MPDPDFLRVTTEKQQQVYGGAAAADYSERVTVLQLPPGNGMVRSRAFVRHVNKAVPAGVRRSCCSQNKGGPACSGSGRAAHCHGQEIRRTRSDRGSPRRPLRVNGHDCRRRWAEKRL